MRRAPCPWLRFAIRSVGRGGSRRLWIWTHEGCRKWRVFHRAQIGDGPRRGELQRGDRIESPGKVAARSTSVSLWNANTLLGSSRPPGKHCAPLKRRAQRLSGARLLLVWWPGQGLVFVSGEDFEARG